jgi:hypothetical protein
VEREAPRVAQGERQLYGPDSQGGQFVQEQRRDGSEFRCGRRASRDVAREAEAGTAFSTPAGETLRRLFDAVVGKAASQIQGTINLLFFDDLPAITKETAAAIAGAT